jgi:metallo-beta-lactamase class B
VRNETLVDGQDLTIGNVSIHIVATPGHTPGCISLIFNVTDHGVPHTVGFYGGGGINANATLKVEQIQSYQKFAPIARAAGVDVYFTNHQIYDETVATIELLKVRQCDDSGSIQEHPWVYGADDYQRWLSVMALCVQLQAARVGQSLPMQS